ncbi:hypothetical protein MPK67_gp052 [Erwinia phage pEa_SNUABM_32]|uniref:Uncharacterized protein n=1 Tax=Erwinia phage pEa_SNUABM_32 TaxID=2869555 RepID=A0AAE7XK02_9CAUD|nr:hypothetical protein MPK67_gp052 [Erwinia phage pEa_SNUABM_32]QZE56925.1 hypothetical protein pEaSNUABM32_00052 [Erwinia phage pEa_SNUABM_32]
MFWAGLGLGVVLGAVLCIGIAWYYLRDFAVFKS